MVIRAGYQTKATATKGDNMPTKQEYLDAIVKTQVNYRIAGMTPDMWTFYRDALNVAIQYEKQHPNKYGIPSLLLVPFAI